MTTYVFSSHDGYGLGHVRRNLRIAGALLTVDPTSQITVVTGLAGALPWSTDPRVEVVRVPPLVKDEHGHYRNRGMLFSVAIERRAELFRALVTDRAPHVVIVDRHPYGTAGELRPGLALAKELGAAVVLGLRDVLDEPERVRAELDGVGWADVGEVFDRVLVYGDRTLCDHVAEYGLPLEPDYCGWVTAPAPFGAANIRQSPRAPRLLVTAGGGGDGAPVFELGVALLRRRPDWTATVLAGPYAAPWGSVHRDLRRRLTIRRDVGDSASHLTSASAVLQMAGYNSTVEAIAAGVRPILMPRRSPRREQAIRASRLAAFGLADVVDEGADAEEVAWLLDRARHVPQGLPATVGLRLDGAQRAAGRLAELAAVAVAA